MGPHQAGIYRADQGRICANSEAHVQTVVELQRARFAGRCRFPCPQQGTRGDVRDGNPTYRTASSVQAPPTTQQQPRSATDFAACNARCRLILRPGSKSAPFNSACQSRRLRSRCNAISRWTGDVQDHLLRRARLWKGPQGYWGGMLGSNVHFGWGDFLAQPAFLGRSCRRSVTPGNMPDDVDVEFAGRPGYADRVTHPALR